MTNKTIWALSIKNNDSTVFFACLSCDSHNKMKTGTRIPPVVLSLRLTKTFSSIEAKSDCSSQFPFSFSLYPSHFGRRCRNKDWRNREKPGGKIAFFLPLYLSLSLPRMTYTRKKISENYFPRKKEFKKSYACTKIRATASNIYPNPNPLSLHFKVRNYPVTSLRAAWERGTDGDTPFLAFRNGLPNLMTTEVGNRCTLMYSFKVFTWLFSSKVKAARS